MERRNGHEIEPFTYPAIDGISDDEVGIIKEEIQGEKSSWVRYSNDELIKIIYDEKNIESVGKWIAEEVKKVKEAEAKKQELLEGISDGDSITRTQRRSEIDEIEATIAPLRDRLHKEWEYLRSSGALKETGRLEVKDFASSVIDQNETSLLARVRLDAFVAVKRQRVETNDVMNSSKEELDSQALKVAAVALKGDKILGGFNEPRHDNPAATVEITLRRAA